MKHLRITLLAGLILLIMAGGILTVFYLIERSGSANLRRQDSFNRILREFDAAFEDLYMTEREIDRLGGELDKLEKRAISVESWLSILKRRKKLSAIHRMAVSNYHSSIENALNAYPTSGAIIAIAAASLVKNTAINRETEEKLRIWLPFLTDNAFNQLRLCIHVILGDFNSPEKYVNLPLNLYSDGTESISVNLAIVKTIRGDYRNAASDIQALLNYPSLSMDALRFAAEYHYDFGSLERSAEIFSFINDEAAMVRQADALYLAGYTDIAGAIWNILAGFSNETSLYNLVVIAQEQNKTEEATALLERLVNLDTVSNAKSRQFGLIRYSRILDFSAALTLLGNNVNFSPEDFPYIDLEICKRQTREQPLGRQIAETWRLLDRHEKNEEIYKWASWFMFFQRSFDEAQILLDRMDILNLTASWIDVYRAILFMNHGNIDMAEKLLRSIPPEDTDWYIYANLGCIMEAVRSPARAIEKYELAVEKLELQKNPKIASRLQTRIARCFNALNRPREARRSFQYALDLDPDNLTARLELDRF